MTKTLPTMTTLALFGAVLLTGCSNSDVETTTSDPSASVSTADPSATSDKLADGNAEPSEEEARENEENSDTPADANVFTEQERPKGASEHDHEHDHKPNKDGIVTPEPFVPEGKVKPEPVAIPTEPNDPPVKELHLEPLD